LINSVLTAGYGYAKNTLKRKALETERFVGVSFNSWVIKDSSGNRQTRPPPKGKKSSWMTETVMDYSISQIPPSDDYLYFDVEYPEAAFCEF